MEHWLPLYYETLETLFDYLPGAAVSFDHQTEEARAHRLERDRRFLRRAADDRGAGRNTARGTAPLYRPVPPRQMFLDEAEWPDGAFRPRRSCSCRRLRCLKKAPTPPLPRKRGRESIVR